MPATLVVRPTDQHSRTWRIVKSQTTPAAVAHDHDLRLAQVRSRIADEGVDALYVTAPANVRYLSGFAGHGTMLVEREGAVLFTDARYRGLTPPTATDAEVPLETFIADGPGQLAELARRTQGRTLAFEEDHLTVAQHRQIAAAVDASSLQGMSRLVEELRLVKQSSELTRLRDAAAIADLALARCVAVLRPGTTELEMASNLLSAARELGADKEAFDPIVASGPNAGSPHAIPTTRPIGIGEPVVIDYGVQLDGYRSDMTRTVWFGELDPTMTRIYEIVRRAQHTLVTSIRAGMTYTEADRTCRSIIEAEGLGEQFSHPTGHNIGLDIHELPYLSTRTDEHLALRVNQVVTVEPGIYLTGVGGVRIEDTVIIAEGPAEVLTGCPKFDDGLSAAR
jgi:Xaa-Pro aminopeptidase